MQAKSGEAEWVRRVRASQNSNSESLHRTHDFKVLLKFLLHVGEVFRSALAVDGRRVPKKLSKDRRHILQTRIVEKSRIIPEPKHAQQRKRGALPGSVAFQHSGECSSLVWAVAIEHHL